MLADERRRAILASLQSGGAVRVTDLAAALSVSEMTVRRDLDVLDSQDLLRKVHGGAVTRHHRGEEPKWSEKARHRRAEKIAIAEAAAGLVGDGMTIAIGAGTTTTELARVLRGRSSITVITNSITVFEVLTATGEGAADDGPAAYLSGGARTPSDALVGPIADTALASFRVDATFLGVHGFDVHTGLTSPNIAEAQTNRTLIEIAARFVVLADHTKFGEVGTNVFARLDQVHTLVVDDGLDPVERPALERRVGELIVVSAGVPA
jgi:DeoR/GlpR family transcriptional regulator of sugar metabolism